MDKHNTPAPTNPTNPTTGRRTTIDQAQIFWDAQDPAATGWWLRYHRDGAEDGCSIEGDEDATIEQLAIRVAAELADYGSVEVRSYEAGREQPRARIVVDGGAVVGWHAL